MAARLARSVAVLPAILLWCFSGQAVAQRVPTQVRVSINKPEEGTTVQNETRQVQISGKAFASGRTAPRFDIFFVIDTSGSTIAPSGIDIDGDGNVGRRPRVRINFFGIATNNTMNTDPGDSVLAAELAAARKLLHQLDPNTTRVGVVAFSGDYDSRTGYRLSTSTPDAVLEQPLTNNFNLVGMALDRILHRGPYGGTNMADGIRLATVELAGLGGSRSRPRPDAQRLQLLLTDGIPTFPIGSAQVSDPGDVSFAISSAQIARKAGIRVDTFAIGKTALAHPVAVTEIARATGGVFTPVRNPADIIAILGGVSFVDLQSVSVVNVDTGEIARDLKLYPDGFYTATLPVREGRNRITARAVATDGTVGMDATVVEYLLAPGGVTIDLSREKGEVAIEIQRLKERNKELQVEIQRERQEAQKKVEEATEVGIEVERGEE